MAEADIQEERSRKIADTTRRALLALNTGGIATAYAVAGSLAARGVSPGWTTRPIAFFVAGLVIVVLSLFLAKHKALKRRDAAIAGDPSPDFKTWYWRNTNWDLASLAAFLLAVVTGLIEIDHIDVRP
jgi:sulfite exporter TauE/SafE